MIRRLVEAHYFEHRANPTPAQVRFWLEELRTPEILMEVARGHARLCRRLATQRPVLAAASLISGGSRQAVERVLLAEETAERARDRRYWSPLRAELQRLRHAR